MWMAFQSTQPVALLVGAGGVNALTGEVLTPHLQKDNYLVTPPQPWLDGWKNQKGTVYQFVATAYEGGSGATVGEQLLGTESKSGGLGVALFTSKQTLQPVGRAPVTYTGGMQTQKSLKKGPSKLRSSHGGADSLGTLYSAHTKSQAMGSAIPTADSLERSLEFSEMGVGKGGEIVQKIHPDPYGLDVWNPTPAHTTAIYIVTAEDFFQITGQKIPEPASQKQYTGGWYKVQDGHLADQPGSGKFEEVKAVHPNPVGEGSVFK
jgi:hypothetical protein